TSVRRMFPDTLFVWSRRGMWRETTTDKFLARGSIFDLVIEPGEIAAEMDRGPTARRSDATRVGPVVLMGPDDLLSREEARTELGMDRDAPALLLSLGAGNINDISSDLEQFSDSARRSLEGWQVWATRPPI